MSNKGYEEGIKWIRILFLGLFIFIFLLAYFVGDSQYMAEKRYQEILDLHYRTAVRSKLEGASINENNKRKEILLDNHIQINISIPQYDRLEVGDSVIKYKGEDKRQYLKANGEYWQEDLGSNLRNKLNIKSE